MHTLHQKLKKKTSLFVHIALFYKSKVYLKFYHNNKVEVILEIWRLEYVCGLGLSFSLWVGFRSGWLLLFFYRSGNFCLFLLLTSTFLLNVTFESSWLYILLLIRLTSAFFYAGRVIFSFLLWVTFGSSWLLFFFCMSG